MAMLINPTFTNGSNYFHSDSFVNNKERFQNHSALNRNYSANDGSFHHDFLEEFDMHTDMEEDNYIPMFSDEEWATIDDVFRGLDGAIICFGFITNLLTLMVLSRRSIGSSTTRIILMFLAGADLATLLTRMFTGYLTSFPGTKIFLSDAGCIVGNLLLLVAQMTAAFYVILLTGERFLAVWFPLKAKSFSTPKIIFTICTLVPIGAMAISAPLASMFTVYEDSGFTICEVTEDKDNDVFNSLLLLRTAMSLYVPCGLVIILNTGIIISLQRSHRQRVSLSLRSVQQARQMKIRRATRLVMTASIMFVVLMIPRAVTFTILFKNGLFYETDIQELVDRAAQLLQYINHAINFFIYLLANRMFRFELMDMMVFWRKSKRRRTLAGRTMSSSLALSSRGQRGPGTFSKQTSTLSMMSNTTTGSSIPDQTLPAVTEAKPDTPTVK